MITGFGAGLTFLAVGDPRKWWLIEWVW
jgi:hypothetical protein